MKPISRYETGTEMLVIAKSGSEQVTAIWSEYSQFFSAREHLPPNWGSYPSQAPLKTSSLMMVLCSSELIKSFPLMRCCFILPFAKPQFRLFQNVDFYFLKWLMQWQLEGISLEFLMEAAKKSWIKPFVYVLLPAFYGRMKYTYSCLYTLWARSAH